MVDLTHRPEPTSHALRGRRLLAVYVAGLSALAGACTLIQAAIESSGLL